jgi:hypothetical protein
MKTRSKVNGLTRSIMKLFGANKGLNPRKGLPGAYYRQVFFNKKMFGDIEFVARIEGTITKATARLLMKAGLSSI